MLSCFAVVLLLIKLQSLQLLLATSLTIPRRDTLQSHHKIFSELVTKGARIPTSSAKHETFHAASKVSANLRLQIKCRTNPHSALLRPSFHSRFNFFLLLFFFFKYFSYGLGQKEERLFKNRNNENS